MTKKRAWPIGALVAVVLMAVVLAACGSAATTTTVAPVTTAGGPTTTAGGASTTAGGAVDAAALYAQDCEGCHHDLPTGGADDIATVITDGKGSMPAFQGKLTADEITALAAWVANGGK